MSYFRKCVLIIRAMPKTIYFNFKYFKFRDAIKFPVLISHHVILLETDGMVNVQQPVKFGIIRIGFGEHNFFNDNKLCSSWRVTKTGIVNFKGSVRIGNGTKINVLGELSLGDNFMISANAKIQCYKKITFGDNVLVG